MEDNYIVYKLISPSGKCYIGRTKYTIQHRIRTHLQDRNRFIKLGKSLPKFYSAIGKYPIEQWEIVELYSGVSKLESISIEIDEISKHNSCDSNYGYNTAAGGEGGDTGKNGELNKRINHSMFMKQHHIDNPHQASESALKIWKTLKETGQDKIRNEKIKQQIPVGIQHWNHTGRWVVRHNTYDTLQAAARDEGLNEWTVNEYCNHPDITFKRNTKLGKKNQTRREAGFYKIITDKEEILYGKI